jgi:hypothetical protein
MSDDAFGFRTFINGLAADWGSIFKFKSHRQEKRVALGLVWGVVA